MLFVFDLELLLFDPLLVVIKDDWNQYLIEPDIMDDFSEMVAGVGPFFILGLCYTQLIFVAENQNL